MNRDLLLLDAGGRGGGRSVDRPPGVGRPRALPPLVARLAAFGAVALTTLLGSGAASAPTAAGTVEIWVRGETGTGQPGTTKHERSRKTVLAAMRLAEVQRYDAQYDDVRRYRSVPLREVLRRYAPPPLSDLAILHFANGMAIPLPFRDEAVMTRLDPFVATGVAPGNAPAAVPTGEFPAIPRKDAASDPRPLRFSGNKVVVAERWHPDVLVATDSVTGA